MADSAEKNATERGHLLSVTKGEDWFPDQPDWNGAVVCLVPALCGGWQTCGHDECRVGSPYDADNGAEPWYEQEEWEFHGELHTYRYGHDWTVPFPGCVVTESDAVFQAAYDIGQQHGEGTYLVDDEWDDTSCTLIYGKRVTPPVGGRS